jgi:beta-glucosidase
VTSVTRPLKELKGFQRVTVEPHQTKTVTFCLKVNQFGFYDEAQNFVVEPGKVEVMVGTSSQDLPCSGEFEIVGTKTDIQASKVFFSELHSE